MTVHYLTPRAVRTIPDKLRNASPGIRIALEMYEIACRGELSGDVHAALWTVVEREAELAEQEGR